VSEYAFASECLRRGFVIAFPCLEALSYDYVLDNGSKLYRVQVKATTLFNKHRGYWQVTVARASGDYSKHAYDVLVIHVPQQGLFYIIPKYRVRARTIRLYPENPACLWAKHLQNWTVFER
jgi:hypothetical protein